MFLYYEKFGHIRDLIISSKIVIKVVSREPGKKKECRLWTVFLDSNSGFTTCQLCDFGKVT